MLLFRHLVVAAVLIVGATVPAAAQRYPFERPFDTSDTVTLDASTIRGKITVVAGPDNRVIVRGTVTVRVAYDVPANAQQIAQRLAGNPPVTRNGDRIELRPPSSEPD